MAGVNATVRVNDGMSSALKSMNKALNIVLSSFESLQNISESAIDTSNIKAARVELNNAVVSIDRLEKELQQAETAQKNLTREAINTGSAMNTLKGILASYITMQGAFSMVNLSDQMAQSESRLKLIVDDDGSVDALEEEIMESANRAMTSYVKASDTISKLALRAGDSFSVNGQVDMSQVVAFTETLNKMYQIAGATADEQYSSMLQLTQALGSGVLRGEEFNAVFEAAPNVMQAVADYMNVPIGKLREMASEGMITADIVKNAIFSASEQVNEDFNAMSLTWSDVMNLFKNQALESSEAVLDKINELANNKDVQTFLLGIASTLSFVSEIALSAFEVFASIGAFIYDNWSFIAPLMYGVIAALSLYYSYLLITRAIEIGSTAIKWGMMLASFGYAAATRTQASATAMATAAQWGFNTALLASPVTWILAIIIAVIVAIYLIVAAINRLTGSSISATGVIVGALTSAAAFIWNLFLAILDIALGVINLLYNHWVSFANFFGNLFNDPVGAILNLFGDMANKILGVMQTIASAIDKVFGSNLASAVSGWQGSLDTSIEKAVSKYGNGSYEKVAEEINLTSESLGLKRWSYSDAYSTGESWGSSAADNVSSKLKNIMGATALPTMPSGSSAMPTSDDVAGNVGKIADNTDTISDTLDITDEDLKYLRNIAEQEAINRFTTAEIKIDMGGISNIVNERSDLDGIVTYLEDKLYESMSIAAEGIGL